MVFRETKGPPRCRVAYYDRGFDVGQQRCSFFELFPHQVQKCLLFGRHLVYVQLTESEQTERVVLNYRAIIHERLWNNPNIIIGTRSVKIGNYHPYQTDFKWRGCLISKCGEALCPNRHRLVRGSLLGYRLMCDSCILNYGPLFDCYFCTKCQIFFCRDCVHYTINKFNHVLTSLVQPLLLNNLSDIQPLSDIIIQYLFSI
jgi:hypothetical protein